MTKLDRKKIDQFEKDRASLPFREFYSKYGAYPKFGGSPGDDWIHLIYTLRAHARGRIHARHIGKICEYGPRIQREKGSGFTYPLISKKYRFEINTLEDQEKLIAKVAPLLALDPAQAA